MRRAIIQTFRTARRTPVRKVLSSTTFRFPIQFQAGGRRSVSSGSKKDGTSQILSASMQLPKYSAVAFLVAVGGGVWYYQNKRVIQAGGSLKSTSTANSQNSITQQPGIYPSVPTQPATFPKPADGAEIDEAEATLRRSLIVDSDQFYADLSENVPLSKSAEDPSRQVLEMLTPDQATQKLRRNEESYLVGRGRGVVRYDVVQIPSNNPIEDDHVEKIVEVPQTVTPPQDGSLTSDWMFWGVFDGHSGWTTSAKLRQVLISFVARELNATYKSALADPTLTFPSPDAIDTAIKKGFLRLDHEIIHESVAKVMKSNSKLAAAELLAPAFSGSCALLSFYDSRSKLLRVACTGDSRAVLGRRGPAGKWTATALSEDQTGGTPFEMARLRAEHPGEENVVHHGRILGGLEPSRAFGDAGYKWTKAVQDQIKKNFFGKTAPALLKTPPYVTAEPIVTTTKMDPEKGDFVVMATDGLWEMLSNEEVVGLVGQWLEAQPKNTTGLGGSKWFKSWLSTSEKSLPVEKKPLEGGTNGDGQRVPLRQEQWNIGGSEEERFVVEDKNAATHLVRNAMGGKNRDMLCALLTLPSPYSRRYRDDLTVEVIFFGDGDKSGVVVQNSEASAKVAGVGGVRAKL